MRLPIYLLFIIFSFSTQAQQPTAPLEQELESIAAQAEDGQADLVQWAEELAMLRENPIALNFAVAEDLERLPMLNIFQISNLLQYRSRTGLIYTPYELAQIKGFDREVIEAILPYLDFSTEKILPELKGENIWRYSSHEIVWRADWDLERRAGFEEGDFLGEPGNYYLRYKGRYRDVFQWGITAQQDPGEPFGGEQKLGVDFISGHLSMSNYGPLKQLVVGSYQVGFGQGLALWTAMAFGKSAGAVNIKRFARGIRPYSGSEENRFMHGVAATIRIRGFDVTGFYSHKRLDGNRIQVEGVEAVSSLQSSGLHRTAEEMADKDANVLESYGGNLNFKGNGYSLGVTAVLHYLQKPLIPKEELYRTYQIKGSHFSNYALDFNRLWQNFNLFGALAFNQVGAMAISMGVQSNLADNLMLSLLYRRFDKAYNALYMAPFAENGQSGERGLYLGMRWEMGGKWKLSAYADHYKFDWPRFRVEAPSRGSDYLLQLEHGLGRFFNYYLRYKYSVREVNPSEGPLPMLIPRKRQGLRLHLAYSLGPRWNLANRLEYAFYDVPSEHQRGFMLFQDIQYKTPKWPLQLNGRVALIESSSFDARLYAYERDVRYTFSIPAYYGQSFRAYLLATYTFSKQFILQLRYGRYAFFDREEISSGPNAVAGSLQSDLKLMLRLKL